MGYYRAAQAVVIGNVEMGKNSSVFYHATVRANDGRIAVGENTNIQDNCVLHADYGNTLTIGDYVTIGHSAIVHGKSVGDNTLIGMGAIILNGAEVGKNCIIGAGALVTQNAIIPDNSVVIGQPGKVIREVNAAEIEANHRNAMHYVKAAQELLDYFA